MDHGSVDVIVDGVRCQVMQQDGDRLLVQPRNGRGTGINVKRWVSMKTTQPLQVEETKPPAPVLSEEEIRQLAAVLRQVFYEDAPEKRSASAR
jgi:hypothetical protein